jgi:hypothetical protein
MPVKIPHTESEARLGKNEVVPEDTQNEKIQVELHDNGSLSLDWRDYRRVAQDRLWVKEKNGEFRYFLPEEERPASATLLRPTDQGQGRKNYLQVQKDDEGGKTTWICRSKKVDIVDFTKRCVIQNNEVDIDIDFALANENDSLEYLLVLPSLPYNNCRYRIQTASHRYEGVVNNQSPAMLPINDIKKLDFSGKTGNVCFIVDESTTCKWISSNLTSQDESNCLLFSSRHSQGTLKVKIYFNDRN